MIVEHAYAKINLTLEVIRKRLDGYHELVSVIQTVDLHDTLHFHEDDELVVECSDATIPDADNLVARAAKVLQDASGVERGARIELHKRIPVSAGLGGGSSDAAATLRGLNRLWDLGMTMQELVDISAAIGSDVPFLVRGGTAIVSGRGEYVEALPMPDIERIVLVTPDIKSMDDDASGSTKTGRMFGMLNSVAHTTGSLSRKLAARMREGKDCHPAFMFNVFQQIAPFSFTDWKRAHDGFQQMGASDITLTGAGPSMFAVAMSKETATAQALLMEHRYGCKAFVVVLAPAIDDPN